MIRFILRLTITVGITYGQGAFLAADVRVSQSTSLRAASRIQNGRFDFRNNSLVQLIQTGYDIEPMKIVGGPRWLELRRFDIVALGSPGTSTAIATMRPLIRALLEDRFKLKVHRDTLPRLAYVLTVNQGKHKLKPAESAVPGSCVRQRQGAKGMPAVVYTCRGVTIDAFAAAIRGNANDYLAGYPIADQTGLTGTWDFDIEWMSREQRLQAGGGGDTFFEAIEKLGLKVELGPVPTSVLVVDEALATPTPNVPNIDELLGRHDEAQFELANIKPVPPDTLIREQLDTSQETRFDARAATLATLIGFAYDIRQDGIAEPPPWLGSRRYNVSARSEEAEAMAELGQLRAMVQALLKERFHLKVHWEDRPATAYKLTAVKPKFARGNATDRASCRPTPLPGMKDPRDKSPIRSSLMGCENITMTEFAAWLQDYASEYINGPLLDATGLEGTWNLMVNYSPQSRLGLGRRASENGPVSSDPTDAISLADALSSQLGLKLEMEKRPLRVLVIDSVDEFPTEN